MKKDFVAHINSVIEVYENEILVRVKKGETITGISSETGIARSIIHSWLKELDLLSRLRNNEVFIWKICLNILMT